MESAPPVPTQALQELPDGYEARVVFDPRKGLWFLVLNVLSLVLTVVCGALFLNLAIAVRAKPLGELSTASSGTFPLVMGIILTGGSLVVHELLHGLGFWWFTRTRPTFGCNIIAAYAGAPGWYIPRNQHLVIGLAPFVVLMTLGVALLLLVPTSLILVMVWLLTWNTLGAAGDLTVCCLELWYSPRALVRDTGMEITIYAPGATAE
jgi:hypothetical protein